jgi:hypothetical protein
VGEMIQTMYTHVNKWIIIIINKSTVLPII